MITLKELKDIFIKNKLEFFIASNEKGIVKINVMVKDENEKEL
jgi:hypothetical protein